MTKYLVFLFVTLQLVCLAQPGDPGNPDVPIGGIEWLVGGGAAIGIRYLMGRYKSNKKQGS